MTIRVVLVDDHTMFREGVRTLLGQYDDIEVVGEAGGGREAVEQAVRLEPHVVLMDLALPDMGGLEATIEILRLRPRTRVLVLTQYESEAYALPILKAGAAGYVVKKETASELAAAIRAVHRGDSFLCPPVARAVLEGYLRARDAADPYDALSDRERQVLQMVAEGRTNREIAELLCVSIKTVMGHRASLMEKLGLHDRTDVVKYALRRGLIHLD